MKKLLYFSVLAAVLAGAALPAAAQTPTVQVRPHSRYYLGADEFADYRGTFDLTNGQTLKLRQRSRHFYARLEGAPEVELYAQAPDVFLTSTGTTVLFRDDGETIVLRGFEHMPGNGPVR